MGNISYFCIVKRIKTFITAIAICIFSLITNEIHAQTNVAPQHIDTDSIEISLLTCAPGKEVYSLYGHTAIRYTNYKENIDLAINYGMFSFRKPYFILRFIFGLTDYEMGIIPYDVFCEEYKSNGRSVLQQKLNLTSEEKLAIIAAIGKNYLPENRTYRYNYFYDNCTTRARDILYKNINGNVVYSGDTKETYPSYREMIHELNKNYPWARFGNDLLLGLNADKKTDKEEQQFLPFNLKKDFDNAQIVNEDGSKRALVSNTSTIVESGIQIIDNENMLRPSTCAYIILAIIVLLTVIEYKYKKNFWALDTLLLIIDGLAGIIIFLMFFSKHPTTSTNLQIFLFNPLPLLFAYRVIKNMIKNNKDSFWLYASACLIIFFIGGFFQDYAEGTYILALSLLVRSLWRIYLQKKK